jgi:transposase-like protein
LVKLIDLGGFILPLRYKPAPCTWIRDSLDYASWNRKALAAALRPIYTATSIDGAEAALNAFEQGPWGQKLPTVAASWRQA